MWYHDTTSRACACEIRKWPAYRIYTHKRPLYGNPTNLRPSFTRCSASSAASVGALDDHSQSGSPVSLMPRHCIDKARAPRLAVPLFPSLALSALVGKELGLG